MIDYFNLNIIFIKYPIGTVLRLKDDYPGVNRVVKGYEIFDNAFYLIFNDGSKLNIDNLDLINA